MIVDSFRSHTMINLLLARGPVHRIRIESFYRSRRKPFRDGCCVSSKAFWGKSDQEHDVDP